MSFRIASSPWACFAGEPEHPVEAASIDLHSPSVMPRLIGPEPTRFLWNRSHPVLASWAGAGSESHWDIALPISPGEQSQHSAQVGGSLHRVEIKGLPDRARESTRDTDHREQWLLWQLQRYAELASMDVSEESIPGLEALLPFGARRSWPTVARLWRAGGEDSAELSLIVKLSKRKELLHALRAIERAPRRMLERRHLRQRIARIQEMDSTTLRAYSRAPGRNAAEKAGSKQELLAVVRTETVDLAENRVLLWCARRMERMASAYAQRNIHWQASERVTLVRLLGRLNRQLRSSPQLESVGALPHHLSTPTYCLQFDRRYRQIWRVYRELRRQERLVDDAWRWHPHLWGTTARVLTASLLSELDGWAEAAISTPYFRSEGICGEWTCGPSTPGPFKSPKGMCELVDFRSRLAHQSMERLGVPPDALESGADWALAWPAARRIVLTWTAVSANDGKANLDTEPLSRRLRATSHQTDWSWSGLILLAEPSVAADKTDWVDGRERLTILRFPEDLHQHWGDLRAGLELALDEPSHA